MRRSMFGLMLTLLIAVGAVGAQRAVTVRTEAALVASQAYRESWALLIGVNTYPNLPPNLQLNYAVNDVVELKKTLVELYEFPEEANITTPNGSAATLTDVTTQALGVFEHPVHFDLDGDWEFAFTWTGNDSYEPVTETRRISVIAELGKVIMVLGGGDLPPKEWATFRGLADYVHVAIGHVSATVIPPDFDPDRPFDSWSALDFDSLDLTKVSDGKYAAPYANFTIPGEYTIIFNANNADGSAAPVQTTITVPPAQNAAPWDVNRDGIVDVFDLVAVANDFGRSGGDLPADIDGNRTVNLFDMVSVANHFGETTLAAAPSLSTWPKPVDSVQQLHNALAQLDAKTRLSVGERIVRDFLKSRLKEFSPIPAATRLLPNFPNPFNLETWIPYQLVSDADVVIVIYDIKGVLVRELNLGHQPAGFYTQRGKAAYWDGRNQLGERIGSGIYLYRLQAGDYTQMRRMGIVK